MQASPAPAPVADDSLALALRLAAPDMARVDSLIRASLDSDVLLIRQIAEHIIGGGGKRLRPMLHVLAARAAGYPGENHIKLAALIEFIHTSTLLHDDVVDESDRRRGRDTANALWGNAASVLVGDFLYSRAFQLMVELDDMRVMRILADTTNTIAEGEVLQLLSIGNTDLDEAACLAVIERKTAVLFAAATELGALLGGLEPAAVAAMREFGLRLGFAFQIADDLLDYVADSSIIGKNVGDDLAEGKLTLPLVFALAEADADQAGLLREAIAEGKRDGLEQVLAAIRSGSALARTEACARNHADAACRALDALPPTPERDALVALARYAVERST